MTFNEIWEQSTQNQYQYYLPIVLGLGSLMLIFFPRYLSMQQRRMVKFTVFSFFLFTAIVVSDFYINRVWELRKELAIEYANSLSEAEIARLNVTNTDLFMNSITYGASWGIITLGIALLISVLIQRHGMRGRLNRDENQPQQESKKEPTRI
ncbi:MAG: hypothetical protein MK193_08390 [Lentisphaeria bacterium]|nr:hypothetical protein [Lentisphaeria bacterium]